MFQFINTDQYTPATSKYGVITGKARSKPAWATNGDMTGGLVLSADTLGGLFRFIKEEYPEAKQEKASSSSGRGDFNTFQSYEECIDIFQNRPHELAHFVPKSEQIKTPDGHGGNLIDFDVTGDYLDVGRYLDGEPEHFGNMMMDNPRNLFATILVNVTAWAGIKHTTLQHRAQRLLTLVDWFEQQHVRTSIKLFEYTQCGLVEVQIKEFHEHVNINNLAVAAHPEFLRRIIFRINEQSPTWTYGYGRIMDFREMGNKPNFLTNGIYVISDPINSKEEVDERWDKGEKEIKKHLEDGSRQFCVII